MVATKIYLLLTFDVFSKKKNLFGGKWKQDICFGITPCSCWSAIFLLRVHVIDTAGLCSKY
jgi:hypothetical protein